MTADVHMDANHSNQSRAFKRLVFVGSALGLAAVFGSLACLGPDAAGGFYLRWRWTALLWMLGGALVDLWCLSLVWRAEDESPPQPLWRMICGYGVLGLAGIGAFLYPIRFVPNERLRDVIVGLVSAIGAVVLGLLILYSILRRLIGHPDEKSSTSLESVCGIRSRPL